MFSIPHTPLISLPTLEDVCSKHGRVVHPVAEKDISMGIGVDACSLSDTAEKLTIVNTPILVSFALELQVIYFVLYFVELLNRIRMSVGINMNEIKI